MPVTRSVAVVFLLVSQYRSQGILCSLPLGGELSEFRSLDIDKGLRQAAQTVLPLLVLQLVSLDTPCSEQHSAHDSR